MNTQPRLPVVYFPAVYASRVVEAMVRLNGLLMTTGMWLCGIGVIGGLAYGYFHGISVPAPSKAGEQDWLQALLTGLSTVPWIRSVVDWIGHPGLSGIALLILLPGLLPILCSLALFSGAVSLGSGEYVRGVLVLGGVGLIGLIVLGVAVRINLLAVRLMSIVLAPIRWVAKSTGPEVAGAELQRIQAPRAAAQADGQQSAGLKFLAVAAGRKFSDLSGMNGLKAKLIDAGRAALARGVEHRNGVLLYGKPGNGKTTIAEALAGELGVRFLSVSIADVQSRWVGQTTEQLVQVFRDARAQAPCVLLLDEVESIIGSRERTSSNDEDAKTTNAFLTEVVRARDQGVIVLAATNYLDRLDQAAIREGRFDFKIEVPPPDLEARIGMLQAGIKEAAPAAILAPAVIEAVARRWEGFSVARLRSIATAAGRSAANGGPVTREGLMAALRSLQASRSALTEVTLSMAELSLDPEQRRVLDGVAWRMAKCFEAEDLGASVPDGMLFYGPPGTGKTAGVRALAKHTGWALFATSGTELMMDPAKIDDIVERAKDARPAIIFIDEAEEILQDRRHSRAATTTNKLLTAMDGTTGKISDLLFIAATNFPSGLDPAMLRGGRFTEKVGFAPPAQAAQEQIISAWLAEKGWQIEGGLRVASDALEGLAPADIKAVLQFALNHAVTGAVMDRTGLNRALSIGDLRRARALVATGDLGA